MSPFKLLSVLLEYPDAELLAARPEIARAAAELPDAPAARAVARFLEAARALSDRELQQAYVATFDFHKRATLYLSYFAYGDRRQRGMAMLDLKRRYRAAGLPLREGELPDYLPAALEFAALAPEEGVAVLRELRPAIELVRASLHEDASPYALLLDAVCELLPTMTVRERERARALALAGPPTETVGLEPFAPPEVMPPALGEVARR